MVSDAVLRNHALPRLRRRFERTPITHHFSARMHAMDPGRDATVVMEVNTKRLYDPIGTSPLSITQPLEESFAEISLPQALGSTAAHKHLLSPYRHTGKCAKALLAFALALVGTLAAAVLQAPMSGVGRSSLPDSAIAELPYVLLVLGVWAYQGARGKMLQLI